MHPASFRPLFYQRNSNVKPPDRPLKRQSGVEPPFEAPFAAQGRQDKPHSKRWAEKQSGVEPPHSKNQRLMWLNFRFVQNRRAALHQPAGQVLGI